MSSDQPSSSSLPRWEKGATRSLAATRIFDVQGVQFRHPVRGTEREFVVIDAPDWVNVLALTPDHRLVMVNQFRYGTDAFSWEIPGGVIDRGEDPVTAGVRELREETGYSATHWAHAGVMHPVISYSTEFIDIWFARGLSPGPRRLDEGEHLDILTLGVDAFFAACQSGLITDAKTLTGALWLQNHLSGQWPLSWQAAETDGR